MTGPGEGARPDSAGKSAAGRRLLIGALVLGLGALLVFGVIAYRTWTVTTAASRQLDEAISLVERADEAVVRIDEVVGSEITTSSAEQAEQAQAALGEAQGMLTEAATLCGGALVDLSADQKPKAEALRDAAQARLRMLEHAPTVLDATRKASSALPLATSAWERTIEADRTSKRAVAAYNRLTKAGVLKSRDLNNGVTAELARAREEMESAEKAFPEAPFEQYLAYIDVRIELNEISKASDAAWLKGDVEGANAKIAAYNEKDERAVKQAKTLPDSPAKAVAEAYAAMADAATKAYYAARDEATEADARVRRR